MNENSTDTDLQPCRPRCTPEEIDAATLSSTKLCVGLGGVCAAILGVPLVGFIVAPLFRKTPEIWRSGRKSRRSSRSAKTVNVHFHGPLAAAVGGRHRARARPGCAATSDDEFIAFSINCTHLGCPVRWLADAELVHVPVPRRRLLQGRHRRRRAAAVAACRAIQCASQNGEVQIQIRADSDHRPRCMKRLFIAVWNWVDDRTRHLRADRAAMKHLVPRDAKWWYVFGSATLCAFMVQVVTGVALAFSYIPSVLAGLRDASLHHQRRAVRHVSCAACITYGASAMVLDGRRAHGAGFPVWLLQISPRNELGDRRAAAGLHAGHGFYRTAAALGPNAAGPWSSRRNRPGAFRSSAIGWRDSSSAATPSAARR